LSFTPVSVPMLLPPVLQRNAWWVLAAIACISTICVKPHLLDSLLAEM
jgi:hypothetical protein